MLAVVLQVPGHDIDSPVLVIDEEDLDQVFDTSGENVLNPDFCSWAELEFNGFCCISSKD